MLNGLKNFVLYKLIRVLDSHFEKRWSSAHDWWEPNLCEPTVQLALRDLCRPGDVVFDVGANHGDLTVLMSRLVGPRGQVCAFEASPRNMPRLQHQLARNGCQNVRITHAAICSDSAGRIGMEYGSHDGADRLADPSVSRKADARVERLCLDDYVDHFGVAPKLVKMDIEGAEYDAICGFRRTIDRVRPWMILEVEPERPKPLELLASLSYRFVDLCNYRSINSTAELVAGVSVGNVLCYPSEAPPPGYQSITMTPYATVNASAFKRYDSAGLICVNPVKLPAGRYAMTVDFRCGTGSREFQAGFRENGRDVFRYVSSSPDWIRQSYRQWTWHATEPTEIEFFFNFPRGEFDPDFSVEKIEIQRVEGPTFTKVSQL